MEATGAHFRPAEARFACRSATHPSSLIPAALLRNRSFSLANADSLVFSAAFFAWLLCDVLYLTAAWHYSIPGDYVWTRAKSTGGGALLCG